MVANGEIWTVEDAQRCRTVSGCDALMLGRGMVADPGLAWALRAADGAAGGVAGGAAGWVASGKPLRSVAWADLQPGLQRFAELVARTTPPRHRAGRIKQWLNLLRRRFPQAQAAFDRVRAVNDADAVMALLFNGD